MSSLEKVLDRARQSVTYHTEAAILEFTADVERAMLEEKVSRAELARRAGVSPAYVTKVLRGSANFTIKSMVMLARALGVNLRINLMRADVAREGNSWQDAGALHGRPAPASYAPVEAANETEWQVLKAA